jgi:hypothetical protein
MINSIYACTPHPKVAAVHAACVAGVGWDEVSDSTPWIFGKRK